MTSVVQAFDRFLRSLEVTDAERAEIARRQRLLVERLSKGLGGVRESILGGAYGRGSAVRPFDEVDVLLVLDGATHRGLREQGPSACLAAIRGALLSEGPNSKEQLELKGRAVNVTIRSTEIGLSIIPAFEESPGVYAIPARDCQGFLNTNPSALLKATSHAHERAASKLLPVIRAAKHWSRKHGTPIAGLHLEALAPKAIPTPPLSYPQAFRELFAKVADVALRSCADPGGVGPDLDAELNAEQRSHMRIMLQDATRQADQALQFDRTLRSDEAHGVWRNLLGTAYPENGKR